MTNLRIAQMALYQFGFAFVCVFVSGVLNRVMFAELGLPATLIGVLLAIPPLLSPLRLWLGYLSDAYPIRGRRRLPYILGGVGLVLIAAGAIVYVRFKRQDYATSQPRKRKRRRKTTGESREEVDASPVYCHLCGVQAGASDHYCRRCGAQLRH